MVETMTSENVKKLEKVETVEFDLVYDGMNSLGHALMWPGRVFADNVFKGIALMGVIGLIGAGLLYISGVVPLTLPI